VIWPGSMGTKSESDLDLFPTGDLKWLRLVDSLVNQNLTSLHHCLPPLSLYAQTPMHTLYLLAHTWLPSASSKVPWFWPSWHVQVVWAPPLLCWHSPSFVSQYHLPLHSCPLARSWSNVISLQDWLCESILEFCIVATHCWPLACSSNLLWCWLPRSLTEILTGRAIGGMGGWRWQHIMFGWWVGQSRGGNGCGFISVRYMYLHVLQLLSTHCWTCQGMSQRH
jgi:hypothetical protein